MIATPLFCFTFHIGEKLTTEEADEAVNVADTDGTGNINYKVIRRFYSLSAESNLS